MKRQRFLAISCTALLLSLSVFGVSAQNSTGQAVPGSPGILNETLFVGVPQYSAMKTEDFAFVLSPTYFNALAPITLPCPATVGAAGCTFRVTVSAQFWNVTTNVAIMNMVISGPGTLGPYPDVAVASNTSTTFAEVHTMQWVKRNIPAGSSPTITLQVRVNSGTGFIGFPTMSVDVFKGLM